jgi:SulP family sulfate permease
VNARLTSHLPLLAQLRGYDAPMLRGDVIAGLSTAIMLIPQAMAYAMLAGLDPIVGLYASTVPLAVYGLLGTSRQLSVGPVAMVSLLVASGVGVLAGGDAAAYAGLAALLALMVGLMQWGMGIARLGFLVKFLSHPVISGFTSAAALVIASSQLGHLLGVELPRSHHVHEVVGHALQQLGEAHPPTLVISGLSLTFLLGAQRWAPRLPRFLIVVATGIVAVWALGLQAQGVAIVGKVPEGLPSFALPTFDLASVTALAPVALTIALVGFMESVSVASQLARTHRYALDANQELVALGAANVAGSLFHGYPVTGGFSRTAVNDQAGARTGVASLVTAGAIVLTLLFLTPLFTLLPKAVLASIILTAVFGLIDTAEARHLWHVSRSDLGLMALTFVATLAIGVEEGILVGVAASLVWFIWRTSKPHVAVLGRLPGTTLYRNVERFPEAERDPHVVAVRLDAPLYFANTAFLKETVEEVLSGAEVRNLVIDCAGIGSVDAQALATLEELIADLGDRHIQLWLSSVRGPVRDAMRASGLDQRLGPEHVVERVHDAVSRCSPPPLKIVGASA